MISNDDSGSQEETWGWGPYGSEEEVNETPNAISVEGTPTRDSFRVNGSSELRKSSSEKSFNSRKQHSSSHALKGIASSPSFQELEKAIGVALSQSSEDNSGEPKTLSPSTSFATSKLSSTNLMQQKVHQHRVRQQQQQQQQPFLNGFQNHQRLGGINQKTSSPNVATQSAKTELSPFINESESRALILFHSPTVPQNLIREVCSKFGVLYYIRPEFHSRGVTLLSYFDLQSALSAKESIASSLGNASDATIYFSIMLHATTSNTEEFRLIVKSLPDSASEVDIQNIFSRYGSLRSIQKTFGSATDLSYPDTRNISVSYSVEFYNIQDARLAASELSATSSNTWGPDATVRFAPLDERKKQLCKQLLGVLSRWRSEISISPSTSTAAFSNTPAPSLPALSTNSIPVPPSAHFPHLGNVSSYQPVSSLPFGGSMEYGIMPPLPFQHAIMNHSINPTLFHNMYNSPYTNGYSGPPFMVENANPMMLPSSSLGIDQLSYVHKEDSNFLAQDFSSPPMLTTMPVQQENGRDRASANNISRDDGANRSGSHQAGRQRSNHPPRENSDTDYNLDIRRILEGLEKRTTIMVRNIPNKYTQQMLLEEVNVKHSGTYDFFYLPIDFKNRCNVGYCFINFLNTRSIPAFVEDFHGQRWKSFNSEKVCAVSFARIQGKQAMIARFQNSSLMDKVDEYKPLLFHSSGPNIGKPELFPVVISKGATIHSSGEEDNRQEEIANSEHSSG